MKHFHWPVTIATVALPLVILWATSSQAIPRSQLPRPALAYVKVCNNGAFEGTPTCPANLIVGTGPSQWGCTYDPSTRFMWEIKQGIGINYDNTQKRQVSMPNGIVRVPTNTDLYSGLNALAHANAVNAAELCGMSNWRVPTKTELRTLLFGSASPRIVLGAFPNTVHNVSYMTSTPDTDPNLAHIAFAILFSNGTDVQQVRSQPNYLRLVALRRADDPRDMPKKAD